MMTYDVWIGKLKEYLNSKKKGNESIEEALILYDATVETSNDIQQQIVDKYKSVLKKEVAFDPEVKRKYV